MGGPREATTFVLIPGAGIDPAVWGWTIAELEQLDRGALAPALPLEDPEAGPSDHAEAVGEALADVEGPITVVGQSLGAFSATLVAAAIEAYELVLLAPMIPAPGETAGEWWSATRHQESIAPLIDRLGPMRTWGPQELREVFLHDVPEERLRDAEHLDGQPGAGMFTEPWPLSSWPDVPTRVIAPVEDRLFPLAFQRRVARERLGLEVEELPGGHVPMLARPSELARRLVEPG